MSLTTLKIAVAAAVIAITLFVVISQCFVLKKAGKHWWFGLVPVLAETELFGIAWKKRFVVFYLVGEAFIQLFTQVCQFVIKNPAMLHGLLNTTVLTVSLLIISVYYVVSIQMSVRLACRFGYSEWFGIGCAVLPFIFFPVLAFSSCHYDKNRTFDIRSRQEKSGHGKR